MARRNGIAIVTPRDLDNAVKLVSAKKARDFLLRVAHEMYVERDEDSEDERYILSDDKDLSGADFIQEVRQHLEATGIEPATMECSLCGAEVTATVECSLCGAEVTAAQAHLHRGKYIGDCCWDERLKASE